MTIPINKDFQSGVSTETLLPIKKLENISPITTETKSAGKLAKDQIQAFLMVLTLNLPVCLENWTFRSSL